MTVATVTTNTPLAYARTAHIYESVITEVPPTGPGGAVPAPGQLSEVSSMTVHSDALYVAEHLEGEGVNEEFSRTDQWKSSPSKPGEYEFVSQLPKQPAPFLNRATGVAFGTEGVETELYVGQGGFSTAPGVNVFADSCSNLECATFENLWTGAGAPSPFEGVGGVAVDHSTAPGDWASGDVFVNVGGGVVDIFEAEAGGIEHYVTQVTEVGGPVAVSGLNGDLVVGESVLRPEEEGAKKGKYAFVCHLARPGGRPLEGIAAVAVDDSTVGTFAGEIYVATSSLTSGSVYEFGPECAFRGDITRLPEEGTVGGVKGQTEEVPFGAIRSLAVDPQSHRVFVGEQSGLGVVDVFGPDTVLPDITTESPSNLVLETDPKTGATSWGIEAKGSVNPLAEGEATCSFAWGVTEAFGQQAPCSGPVPNGASPVTVHAGLTGLEPDTAYVYRMQAGNAHSTNRGEESEDYRFTTPGPGLRSESASEVSSTAAALEATIAPHDAPVEEHDLQASAAAPTLYFFQYSTQSTSACAPEPSACASVPLSPASVGSGSADVEVSRTLTGLTPNTTYHYRLVAENEALPVSEPGKLIAFYGPDRTFTTQGPGGPIVLPDGRAWELVSPADKHGAKIYPSEQAWASVDGGKFAFLTNNPTEPEPPGAGANGVQVLASRVAPGQWSSVDINLSRGRPEGPLADEEHEYRYFSPDLSSSIVESEGPFSVPEGSHQNERGEWERIVEASPVPTERTPYLRHNSTCATARATCFEPLLDSEDVTSGEGFEGPAFDEGAANFVGATPDARHALISSSLQLTHIPTKTGGLYEWSIDRPPAERLSLVNVVPETGKPGGRFVEGLATDGSRVLFSGCAPLKGCGGLYLHDVTRDETVRVDLAESGSVPSLGIGRVAGTSPDLSKILFTDGEMLTRRSGADGADLYVCELGPEGPAAPKCALTDLTPARPTGLGAVTEAARVSRTLNVSPDGSYVYFLAKGVQAAGAVPAEGERENLYIAHEQEGKWVTTFIASPAGVGPESVISPDGRWLAFSSISSLTGYDNRDAKTGSLDSEVYLYDTETGRLVCASCNSSGARPLGPALVPSSSHGTEGGFLSGMLVWQQEPGSRSLFVGGRLFFDSADALVPQDTNGYTDVYEFEPAGVGSCTVQTPTFDPATGGCVGLISSGRAPGESLFMEASANGSDVFFSTAERLVRKDSDTAVDVYDAHECTTASPCAAEESPQQECASASQCRTAPAPQPSIFGPPSSTTFAGPGNIPPEPRLKPGVQPKTATQKLAFALRACRKLYPHAKKRRATCERAAHRTYAPKLRLRAKKSDRRRSR